MLTITMAGPPDADPHPQYEDFPDHGAYVQAFHMWRARRRDGRLNDEELAAQFTVIEETLRSWERR